MAASASRRPDRVGGMENLSARDRLVAPKLLERRRMAKNGPPLRRRRSRLMRPAHHLHGFLKMAPLARLLGVALVLAGDRVLRGLVNGLGTVLLEHLARDHVDLHLGNHGALLMSINRSRKLRRRLALQPPGPGFRSLTPRSHFAPVALPAPPQFLPRA